MVIKIRGSTPAYLNGLVHSITTPFAALPPRWRVEDTLILMLRKENFIPSPKKWSDFSDALVHQAMMEFVFFVAKALTSDKVGNPVGSIYVEGGNANDPNAIPKVGVVTEDLLSEHGFWEGLRIFFFILDPTFNADVAVQKLLEDNKYLDATKTTKKDYHKSQCFRKIFTMNDYAALLKHYAPKVLKNVSWDAINNPNDPFYSEDEHTRESRFSLYNILKPANAFTSVDDDDDAAIRNGLHTEGICERQLNMNNYFNLVRGERTFTGFPKPDITYRHFTNFFAPDKLYNTPLPGNLSQNVLKQYNEFKAKLHEIRNQLDEVDERLLQLFGRTEEDKERARTTLRQLKNGAIPHTEYEKELFQLSNAKNDLIDYATRIKDESATLPMHNMIKIARMALEDTDEIGKLLLSKDMIEASFAEKNDIIKLKLENVNTWAVMDEAERKSEAAVANLREDCFTGMTHNEYVAEKDRLYEKLIEGHEGDDVEVQNRYRSEFVRQKRSLLERAVGGEDAADDYQARKRNIYETIFNPKTKPARVKELMQRLCKDVWTKVTTSNKLTAPLINGRNWFLSLDPSKHFADLTLKYKNMSVFGNMIIDLTRDLDKVKQLDNQFQLTVLMYLNIMCTYHYTLGSDTQSKSTIRPNLFITGDAGVGKSFAMQSAGEFAFPGSTSSSVHFSEHAFSTGVNMDQLHYLCEETPYWMIGIGRDGKPIPINPILKQRLATGVVTTQVYRRNADGVAETVTTVTPASTSGTYASNPATSDAAGGPFMQRVVGYNVKKRKNVRNSNYCDAEYQREPKIIEALAKEVSHAYHLQHFYLMLWETLITARAIPFDIDINEMKLNGDIIFDYFKTRGINTPSDRHTAMCGELCRAATMMNGIRTEFFSEVGIHHRRDNLGNHKPFDVLIMLDLIKYGCASKEVSLFVLSLMENAWIPYNKIDVAKICCRELTILKYKQANFMEVEKITDSGPVKEIDMRYIKIEDTHDNAILARIQSHMKERPSLADLGASVRALTSDTIDSPEYQFYDPAEYPRLKLEHRIDDAYKNLNELVADSFVEPASNVGGDELKDLIKKMSIRDDSDAGAPENSSGDEAVDVLMRLRREPMPMRLFVQRYIQLGMESRKLMEDVLYESYLKPIIELHPSEILEGKRGQLTASALFKEIQNMSVIPQAEQINIALQKVIMYRRTLSEDPEAVQLIQEIIDLEGLHYCLARSEKREKERRTNTTRITRIDRSRLAPSTNNSAVRQHALAAAQQAQLSTTRPHQPPAQADQAPQQSAPATQSVNPDFLVFTPRLVPEPCNSFSQYAKLLVKIGSEYKNIECAKQVTDTKTRKRILYIATALNDMDYSDAMRTSLKKVEHRFQEEKTCITGLTYERTLPDGTKEPLYQVFDVIKLSPKHDKIMSIGNKASMDQHTLNVYRDDFGINIDPNEVQSSVVCNEDTETFHFMRYWASCGLPNVRETHTGFPEVASQMAWHIRYNHPYYADKQRSILEKYPEDYIAILDEDRKRAMEMKSMETKERMLKEGRNLLTHIIHGEAVSKKSKRQGKLPYTFKTNLSQEGWAQYFSGVDLRYNGPVRKAANRPQPIERFGAAGHNQEEEADFEDMVI